ncbi:MAG: hypothetical protein MUF64_17685 [Polyangiaceae bacterium]|jgi:hypothetical protein|nr:hypothetical protein [Polyangiaceae bacterium]
MEPLDIIALTHLPFVGAGSYREQASVQQASLDALTWYTQQTGVSAYDLRMRLVGPAPWWLDRAPPGDAAATVAALQARGFGAVHFSPNRCAPRRLPSSLVVHPGALGLEDGQGQLLFAYDAVRFLAVMTLDQEQGSERVEQVVINKHKRGGPTVVEISRHGYERTQLRALRVFLADGPPGYQFMQGAFAAPSLPARTSRERVDGLLALLRARCPGAWIDERLALQPRKRSSFLALQPRGKGQRDSISSNSSENDLAACALALAFAQGQLPEQTLLPDPGSL